MTRLPNFPDYSLLKTKKKIDDLVRLSEVDLTKNEYVFGKGIAKLLGALFKRYKEDRLTKEWLNDPFIGQAEASGRIFNLFLAAAFDLAVNMEYAQGRLVNSRWIYCHREGENCQKAYYSYLKQCPKCCLDKGLENRLSGAQHKPSSHHIGEITTTVIALLLKLIAEGNESRLSIATITKQSHDVDAIGYCDDLIALLEIKASPMVTFPFAFPLPSALYEEDDSGPIEYRQHKLIDVLPDFEKITLELPHRDTSIPLPRLDGDKHWPFEAAQRAFSQKEWTQSYFSAWLELFDAYSVPKTQRSASQQRLTYLVNGWGDEIDSNKTKPGLGRTDDIKKGTYQLLKFGAYYNDEDADLKVKGLLVANLDPLFLKENYFDGLRGVRWGMEDRFEENDDHYTIAKNHLHYLYSAVIAFNDPVVNDETLQNAFEFKSAERALMNGQLDQTLEDWIFGDINDALVES
ncbi:MAG: hypothetical protein EOP17_00590 [Rhizobiaceae bacterium]|nr:MAG: hypothetical protein EOP17_00590 [Rhizobiaceae bacterium]